MALARKWRKTKDGREAQTARELFTYMCGIPIMLMKPGQPCVDPGFLFDWLEDWMGFIRARKHEDWPAFDLA